MRRFFLIAILFLSINKVFAQSKTEIEQILKSQENLWNAGDIPGFMQYYWKDEKMKFISKNDIKYGWQTTLDRYLKDYPDKEAMGKLKFHIFEVDLTSKNMAWVLGKWHLSRPRIGDIGGHFTLVFKKIKGKWVIVSDHTS